MSPAAGAACRGGHGPCARSQTAPQSERLRAGARRRAAAIVPRRGFNKSAICFQARVISAKKATFGVQATQSATKRIEASPAPPAASPLKPRPDDSEDLILSAQAKPISTIAKPKSLADARHFAEHEDPISNVKPGTSDGKTAARPAPRRTTER